VNHLLRTLRLSLLASALLAPLAVQASPSVAIDSAVYVERRVVTVVTWRRTIPGGSFVLTNPLPRGLWYQGSAMEDEEVSVDGGKTWGRLGDLRSGNHLATPEDVTHVRWSIASTGASGRIAYSAIVRR